MRRALLSLCLVALGAVGCKDFHYYDIDVSLDGTTFTGNLQSRIQTCHVFVTGAETNDFYITENCPPPNLGFEMGTFEYSSLADSGQLTFTMKVYNGTPEGDSCFFGQGSTTITVPAETTVPGMLKVTQSGPGC